MSTLDIIGGKEASSSSANGSVWFVEHRAIGGLLSL
jgi:hypothetical protein